MDGLVSVVIPTYNRAYCICRAIDSVREQTHSNWEVVIVDDGSTDETSALVAAKYADDPRVRYIYKKNGGVSAARNTGIRESRGDYVAFLDSDDAWKPWKLETQLACFKSFPEVGMVWTEFEAVDTSGEIAMNRCLRSMYEAYKNFDSPDTLFRESRALTDIVKFGDDLEPGARVYVGNIYVSMLRGNLVHTSTVMLSRARIEKVKGFDEGLVLSGEDYDFHFRTCKWGDVCFVDVPSTIYQVGFEDRLTKFRRVLALNFLKTVQNAVERERGTGTFPSATVHAVLAEAHEWVAEEYNKAGDNSGVRKHALLALRHRSRQHRVLTLLAISLVPRAFSQRLLPSYRGLKYMIFGNSGFKASIFQ